MTLDFPNEAALLALGQPFGLKTPRDVVLHGLKLMSALSIVIESQSDLMLVAPEQVPAVERLGGKSLSLLP